MKTNKDVRASAALRRRRWVAHGFAAALLAVWALGAWQAPVYLLPGPWDVAKRLAQFFADPFMWTHLAVSIFHVAAAIALSFLIGTGLALLAYYAPVFHLAVHGRISPFLNSFSGIGWTLLAVLWFGLSDTTVIFTISMVLIPFAIINMRAGLDSLDPELLEMARSFGRGGLGRFRRIVLPTLYPYMVSTLRISFGVAWKVALTAELFGGNAGFGYLFNIARQDYDTPLIVVVIVLMIAFVYTIDRYVIAPAQLRSATQYHAA